MQISNPLALCYLCGHNKNMRMKKIIALALFSTVMMIGFGQMPGNFQRNGQQGQMPTGRFYGKIVDAANKGIEAASVVLVTTKMDSVTKKPKEVIVGGMLTTGSGDFSIENVPLFGKYKLRVTGIGYKTVEQPVAFSMPNRNGGNNGDPSAMLGALDKDLGNITLEIDNQVLGNVTVTASKPLLQLGIDRKVFNVDKNIVSTGGTAVDVMKNVPSLNVDIDGNVTLRNAAPQLFVDGRPTNLTLEQIPADAIESVEIITNPSAKFDASGGTAGILNIVLKKNKRVGYSGNLRASVDSRGKVGGGGDINIRQNKINFFASGNYFPRKSISTGFTDRINKGDTSFHSVQNDRSTMNGAFGFGRAGFDFFIDNRNTLTVNGMFARGHMSPDVVSDINIDSVRNSSVFGAEMQKRYSNSDNTFRNMGTQLSFKHNFPKTGHEWTADLTYNKGKNSNSNVIKTDYYNAGGFNRTYSQTQTGSGNNENFVAQTDYSNPLTDKSKLEVGARMSIRNVNSETNYFIANKINSTVYNSSDKIYAAYVTFSNKLKNVGYQVGLRAESSDYQGNLPLKSQSFDIEFPISLFPSVFLSQKLSDYSDLQLNYSRRINRPNFWQLFPFTDYSDSLNISRGNPGLNPEFTNSVELSYSKTFKNRDNFLASIYFKNTNDLITRYQTFEFDSVLGKATVVSSYINANRSYVTGLELIGKNKLTKFWDLTTNLNLFTSKIDLTTEPDPDQFVSYFIKINNSFKLPKNFSVQLSADYQSKIISAPGGSGGGRGGGFGGGGFYGGGMSAAQGYIRPNYGVDAAVRFDFLKEKRASISLNVNDIFRTRKYDAYTQSAYFEQNSVRRRDAQVFRLNFNWRFGKFDANLFKRKDTRAENNVNMENVNF
jgi:outer membrane receptor protein involved in Fe transport